MSDSCVAVVFFVFPKVSCQDLSLADALDDDRDQPGQYSRTTQRKSAVENKSNHSVF